MIQGHGYSKSEVIFIGDTGSQNDLSSGRSLSAASDRMLRQLCNNANLKLDSCYCTLLVKDYLPGFGFSKKRDVELLEGARGRIKPYKFEDILLDEIKGINPNVVVPMGNLSLKFLTGEQPIDKFRGSILKAIPDYGLNLALKIIPTFSPQHIFEKWSRYSIAQVDFQTKIEPLSKVTSFPEAKCLLWIARTGGEAHNYFKRNQQYDWCTLDIETYYGLITCISFCYDGYEAVSFPLADPGVSIADRVLIFHEVAKALDSPIAKVGQNIKYDWTILDRFGFRVRNIIGDTMLAAHTIYPELPKGLDFLTSIYTNFPYYKDEGKESISFPPDKKHLLYNAKDALVTYQVYKKQQDELKELGLSTFYHKRVMPLFFTYKRIEERGIRVDQERRENLRIKYQTILEVELKTLEALVGREINPGSPKQVAELVYKDLKFPTRIKHSKDTGAKGYNTGEEVLEELVIFSGDKNKLGAAGVDILWKIILCRKLAKIIEFLEIPIHPDGTFKTSYKLHGTETGRTSGSKTIDGWFSLEKGKLKFTYLGASFQTIPKHGFQIQGTYYGTDVRSIFVPSPGYVFVEGDQSQAEARHVAILSQDYDLLALFDKTEFKTNKHGLKDDVHTVTATWITGKDFEDITKEDRQEIGKKSRHAGNYGMGPERLSLMAHIPLSKAVTILERFHAASPRIRGIFHTEITEAIKKSRCLLTPYGRRRDFLGRVDASLFKEGYAYIPQSTTSDHQKFGMLRIEERIPGVTFLMESHDSTLAEIKRDEVEQYCTVFKEELTKPISYLDCTLSRDYNLVVPVELAQGENLAEMGEINL